MDLPVQLRVSENEQADRCLVGPFFSAEAHFVDEADALRRAFRQIGVVGTLFDVGARCGEVSLPYLEDHWRIYAFESDRLSCQQFAAQPG